MSKGAENPPCAPIKKIESEVYLRGNYSCFDRRNDCGGEDVMVKNVSYAFPKLTLTMAAFMKSSSQNLSPSLLSRLSNLLKTSQWSDCTFVVGDNESRQEFRAHRILLASSSPVFEAMCFGPLAETDSILIPDLEPAAFQILLQYVYTDSAQFSSVEEACDVLYAAKKYMLFGLSQMCHSYLICNMQAKHAVAVFEYAKLLQEEALFEPCLLMLRKYAFEVLSDSVHHISPASLSELLASDAVNGCESCLIEGALSWAARECRQRNLQPSVTNQRLVLENCNAWLHLRFLTLTPQQFSRISQMDGLLTAEEISAIKEYLNQRFENLDGRKSLSCVNMCNNSSNMASHDDSTDSDKNANIVVVRDKWKRRRLNVVLCGPESDSSSSKCEKETHAGGDHFDFPLDPSIPLPASISRTVKPRLEVGYRLSFCRRTLLKQSQTVSGPLTLQLMLRVSSPIDLRAVQLYSRIIPPSVALYKSNVYFEKIEMDLLDDTGKILAQRLFTEKVEYNTEIMVPLNKSVRLTQDRNYSIVVRLLDSVAEYPLSYLGPFTRSQGINFHFIDLTAKSGAGFVNRLDMGFIHGLAYS